MAERGLNLEPEVRQILSLVDRGNNFLLSGGAGSGKTYSLVQVIRQLLDENPVTQIACVTYTNVAAQEIQERVLHPNLHVSTIHDFLWDNIKHFQKELRVVVTDLINNPEVSLLSLSNEEKIDPQFFASSGVEIQYREYLKSKEGIISHNQVIVVAEQMFRQYEKLRKIVQDRYRYIFIDEYQDTDVKVVEMLLLHLGKGKNKSIMGFFGDSMQSIYPDGVGSLEDYSDHVIEVQKVKNRRNPGKVIQLANKLRTDSLTQQPSSDANAPNMVLGKIKEGQIFFLCGEKTTSEDAKRVLGSEMEWDFADSRNTKELNLTHNLIAEKAGFPMLMEIYDKDPVYKLTQGLKQKIKQIGTLVEDGDTFEDVARRVPLLNRKRESKLDILLNEPETRSLFAIVMKQSFLEVAKMYINKDSLIDDKKQNERAESKKGSKRDRLIKHLFRIQNCLHLYENKQVNAFIKATDFRIHIRGVSDKIDLRNRIDELRDFSSHCSIEEIISAADKSGIVLIDDDFSEFIENNSYLYSRVKSVPFSEIQSLFTYLEGFTPFSTQHKTKGAEYPDVFIVLDNGGWTQYNFGALLTGAKVKDSILERTKKLFYVCCTRAMERLAIVYLSKTSEEKLRVMKSVADWIPQAEIIDLDLK